MSHYIVDKRDLQFVLYEQLELMELTALPRYSDFERDDFELILDEAIRVATGILAPLNRVGDEQGCRFDNGVVHLPEGLKEAYQQYCRGGWLAPHHSVEDGGQGLPLALAVAVIELVVGANPSFIFLPGLTAAATHVLLDYGSEALKARFLPNMLEGVWTGTMCLTEAHAGSAVGDLSTTATPIDGGELYRVEGTKIFISAGDHDAAENIIHLVLARVEGDPPGTKGLSLFVVPKYWVDRSGQMGGANDVVTMGIEHKMGINAAPTCSLAFGSEGECRGYLLGEQRMGIVYMFQMMNEARIMCGVQGAALANAAYQRSLSWARERVQGAKVTDRGPNAQPVPIVEHPDVRRNLLLMKSIAEGIRALILHTAHYANLAESSADEAERQKNQDLLDLLTPICKAYATDQGFWVTERAVQVYGGYGYIREYPVEQYLRDCKIASIYEGTNGIQALDLLGRKMRLKNGGLFMTWLQEATSFVQEHKEHPRLAELVSAVDEAKNTLGRLAYSFPSLGAADPEALLLQATPFLEAFGHVEVARLLVHQAVVADSALQTRYEAAGAETDEDRRQVVTNDREARFYAAKTHTAEFFCRNVLPHASALAGIIGSGDRSALDIMF